MERGEAAERRRQRAAGDLLDHTETHRAMPRLPDLEFAIYDGAAR